MHASWGLSVDPCMLGGLPDLLVLVFLVTSVQPLTSKRAAEQKLWLPSSTAYGATSTVVSVASTVALWLSTCVLLSSSTLLLTLCRHTISSHEFYLRSVRQSVSNYTRYARLLSCFWVLHHGGSFSFCERFRFSLQSPHTHMLLVRHPLGCKTLPSPIRRQLVDSSHHRLLLHSEHNITITKLSQLHPSPSRVTLLCLSFALTMNHMHDCFPGDQTNFPSDMVHQHRYLKNPYCRLVHCTATTTVSFSWLYFPSTSVLSTPEVSWSPMLHCHYLQHSPVSLCLLFVATD